MDPPAYDDTVVPELSKRSSSPPEMATPSRLDDPFKPRIGRHLVWKDVQMTLKKSKGDEPHKVILNNVWGEVPKGQVTAIMGPSGSG